MTLVHAGACFSTGRCMSSPNLKASFHLKTRAFHCLPNAICIMLTRQVDLASYMRSMTHAGKQAQHLVRIAVRAPAERDEGSLHDCPVCMEVVKNNTCWVIFHCNHATCIDCYERIFSVQDKTPNCPLCRAPLAESISGEMPAVHEPIATTLCILV